jgi:hypothetical protein
MSNLFYNTANPLLIKILKELMIANEFSEFRLSGDTALVLQRGHRESAEIYLSTNKKSASINFNAMEKFLKENYEYVEKAIEIKNGKSYFVGKEKDECIKLDILYGEKFARPITEIDGIRLASTEELIAMKVEEIVTGGRKKDLWDLHELITEFSFDKILSLHKENYPQNHHKIKIKEALVSFSEAENDFEPVCLRNKYWEVIKLDLLNFVKKLGK